MKRNPQNAMQKIRSAIMLTFSLALLLILALSAMAQTNTFPSSGSAGIGTTVPSQLLEVRKDTNTNGAEPVIQVTNATNFTNANWAARLRVSSVLSSVTNQGNVGLDRYFDSNGSLVISTDAAGGLTFSADNNSTHIKVLSGGNVGIGTASPSAKLHVAAATTGANYAAMFTDSNNTYGPQVLIGWTNGGTDNKYKTLFVDSNGFNFGKVVDALNAGPTAHMTISNSGNVGIGTTTPNSSYKLDVNGNTNITGNVNVTGNIAAKYQDVAEWVPASEKISAGSVVVLDPSKSNQVMPSAQAYDTRVAGVISEQPGIALGERGDSKVLVATTGRVRVKVDASRNPIHVGDLLVTSDIPGMAMKSQPVNISGVQLHRPGTLIGKALEPLAKGSGEILVLLGLQ